MESHFPLQPDHQSQETHCLSLSDKYLILIVDDLVNNLRFLRDTLLEQGYDVRSTTKGKTALKVVKTLKPDLILLDIKMPDIDGYQISRQLKTAPETQNIPIIFLSAMSGVEDKAKAFESGAIDFISKPFQVQEVVMRVKNHLTLQILQKNLQKQNQALQQEIEQRKEIEKALFAEKELAQITLNSIGDAVITTDKKGQIIELNPAAEKLTGYKSQLVKGILIEQVFSIFDEATGSFLENPVYQALNHNKTVIMKESTLLINKEKKEYVIDYNVSPIRDDQQKIIGTILVFRDITESRNLSRQLSWQATHDNLTRLLNRETFEKKLRQTLANVQDTNDCHVFCYLDLDKFKLVNDSCGHLAGDELLRQLTGILTQKIRSKDTFARLGGDEFGLLLYNCPLQKAVDIAHVLKNIIQEFRFIWDHKSFAISVSIGLVEINHYTCDINTVLKAADAACYKAKEQGRNCVQVYQLEAQEIQEYKSAQQWMNRIQKALEDNNFCLYFQQIISLNFSGLSNFQEILLRLKDNDNKLIPPMAFIPAAERYHLMPMIDQWVIKTFLDLFLKDHHQPSDPDTMYSINLSGTSLNHPQFCHFLQAILAQTSFPCHQLCFEITETTAIGNLNQVANFMENIKALGCHFALDDLGNSMNSFAYLKQLPIDYLKIESSLVQTILDNPINYIMVESIHQISQILNMKTIAEGINTQKILNTLKSMGIHYGQGYAIAQPRPFLRDE